MLHRSLLFVRSGPARMQARLASAWMPIRAWRPRWSRLHEGESRHLRQTRFPQSPSPGFAGMSCGRRSRAFARDSPAVPERCEPVRLGGRAWDSQGGCPLGGGMGRAAPCAMRHLSAGFPGGRARRHCGAGASTPETRGGRVQRSGLPGSARAGPSQPRCRGELGARRGRSRRLRPLRAPGVGRYAMDSANEPSLLMWCLSRALPALTTIMSMPSKRTGTSPSGV